MTHHPRPCRTHTMDVRARLHADPSLGCGNFLEKVLAEDVDRSGWLFDLQRPWSLPDGRRFERLSLADLGEAVDALAAWYGGCGVVPGEIVLTYTAEGIGQFIHSLALISLGSIPAPVNWRMPPDIVLQYMARYGFDHLASDGHANQGLLHVAIRDRGGETVHELDARPRATTGLASSGRGQVRVFGEEDELVMLCHSSGTTGIPKAVMFGHRQFFAGKRDRLLHFLERDDERMFCALPHSHSAGFSYLMTAVLLGLPARVMTENVGVGVARDLLAFQPTVMAGFSQTYASLAESGLEAGNVPSLRRCYNTGDTAHEVHVRSLLKAAPSARFFDGFGASELGMALFCSVSSLESGVASRRNVGRPVPFAQARVVDESGASVSEGSIGYLAVRSPTITPGYYRDPLLTARCRTPEGDWLMGDVGYLDETGSFIHLDRAVDVIQTSRGAAYTLTLEESILRKGEVFDVAVSGAPLTPRASQAVVAWIRTAPDKAGIACAKVLEQLAEALEGSLGGPVPVAVVNLDPSSTEFVGATGKVLKRRLRDEFWPALDVYENHRGGMLTHAVARHFPSSVSRREVV